MTHTITTLPVALMEAHARCNCRCVMCDLWKATDARRLSMEQLEAQLDSLERLSTLWVVFTGGEPLMNPNIFALAGILRRRGIRVTILSSGLLFERYAREIAEHIDDVIVSLDGPEEIHNRIRGIPDAFGQIEQGVNAIHKIDANVAIAARCTVQKLNHAALSQTACDAQKIGLASISFLAADLTSNAFNRAQPWTIDRRSKIALSATEIQTLDLQLGQLIANPFVVDSPRHLLRISRLFRAYLGLEPGNARVAMRHGSPLLWELTGRFGHAFSIRQLGRSERALIVRHFIRS